MVMALALTSHEAAYGQHFRPAGVHSQTLRQAPLTHPIEFSRQDYILIGVVAGGMLGGYLAYNDVKNSDAILGVIGVALAAVGGAAVGALLGWIVYELAHPKKFRLSNEELKLPAPASDAAGSLRSPAAFLMVRRSLTPAR